jgi:hypothetical protein
VLSICRIPDTVATVVGVNVIPNDVDCPDARVRGRVGGGVNENGALVLMSEMVAVEVPEFLIVNVIFSDWLTVTGVKTAVGGVPTVIVVPALVT